MHINSVNIVMFWPVVALVSLTMCVWLLMYYRRIREIRRTRIDLQSLSTSASAVGLLKDVTAADNFQNLLEAPVLFYVICIIGFVADSVTAYQVFLAWAYVLFRYAHSIVHVTYNNVVHRWFAYIASTLCLLLLWVSFSLQLYRYGGG